MQGKFQQDDVFAGLIEALILKQSREERGRGMQNFKYAPAYDEWMYILQMHSPSAYTFISKTLPTRSQRSIQ
jgi:hypothetical protein